MRAKIKGQTLPADLKFDVNLKAKKLNRGIFVHGENFIVLLPKLICESALNSILNGGQVGNLKKFPIEYIKTQ